MAHMKEMNLSFAGCGFLGVYHIGVAVCFRQYAPQLLLNQISGASAGALAACSLLCDIPLDEITSDVLRIVTAARKHTLGPFSPKFNVQTVFRKDLERSLPDDCYKRASGRLFISLTRACDGRNVIVSEYRNKKDLIDALLSTTFIPFFSGFVPPKFRGVRYLDGGFSDNLPTLDENTITVSPFGGETDICPRDDSSQLFHINLNNTSIELSKQNMYRCTRILFPPHPEILSKICKQGFDDAMRFLHRNNLISCARCLAVQSTFTMIRDTNTMTLNMERNELNSNNRIDDLSNCADCHIQTQNALVSEMPETMRNKFREAIDASNNGLVNWIFQQRSVKILCVLSLPYTLPIDIIHATIIKFLENAPSIGNSLWSVTQYLLENSPKILNFIMSINKSTKDAHINAKDDIDVHLTSYNINLCEIEGDNDETSNTNVNISFADNSNKIRNHLNIDENKSLDEKSFETFLTMTKNKDSLMTFYYTDNDKVKMTQFFDVTSNDEINELCNTDNIDNINVIY